MSCYSLLEKQKNGFVVILYYGISTFKNANKNNLQTNDIEAVFKTHFSVQNKSF